MRQVLIFFLLVPVWVSSAFAGAANKFDQLYQALYLSEMVAVMRIEGLQYAEDISDNLLQEKASDDWRDTVERIYGVERLNSELSAELAKRLNDADLDLLLDYYRDGPGKEISAAELEARQALLSEEVEAEAHNLLDHMREVDDPRVDLLDRFMEQNHLVDRNVAGALNSSYEFYFGLIDSGAIPTGMTETEVLREVMGQEPEIRAEVESWIWAYQVLAYEHLSDQELKSYLAFTQQEEGRQLLRGLFESFDAVFRRISRDLGLAAGLQLVSEEI